MSIIREIVEENYEKGAEKIEEAILKSKRVSVLPENCGIGDTVYFVIKDFDRCYIEEEKIIDVSKRGFFIASTEDVEDVGEFIFFSEIGKTVFLNLEDARGSMS